MLEFQRIDGGRWIRFRDRKGSEVCHVLDVELVPNAAVIAVELLDELTDVIITRVLLHVSVDRSKLVDSLCAGTRRSAGTDSTLPTVLPICDINHVGLCPCVYFVMMKL
jgi:hypothetical protein